MPGMTVGTVILSWFPSPNCPLVLSPQLYALPSLSTAIVWPHPAATSTICCLNWILLGLTMHYWPSWIWEDVFLPHPYNYPVWLIATVWCGPSAILRNSIPSTWCMLVDSGLLCPSLPSLLEPHNTILYTLFNTLVHGMLMCFCLTVSFIDYFEFYFCFISLISTICLFYLFCSINFRYKSLYFYCSSSYFLWSYKYYCLCCCNILSSLQTSPSYLFSIFIFMIFLARIPNLNVDKDYWKFIRAGEMQQIMSVWLLPPKEFSRSLVSLESR